MALEAIREQIAFPPSFNVYCGNVTSSIRNIPFTELLIFYYLKLKYMNNCTAATMLTVPVLGDEWRKEGISVNAVYPGVCSTNIKRHMGVDKSITGEYFRRH